MGHFGFFQLIKSYAEVTLLIDKNILSQEVPYTSQQSLRSVKSPKNMRKLFKVLGLIL